MSATLTFKQLADLINSLPKEQQDCDVSIYVNDEYFEILEFGITAETDVLDKDHPVICCDDRDVMDSDLDLHHIWYYRSHWV